MSKILKNQTANAIVINDVGRTVPASGQYIIPPQEYPDWAGSSDIIVQIGNGNIIVNDGSFDLTISDGTDLIKGIFPTKVSIQDTSGNAVSVTGGKLDVNASVTQSQSILKTNIQKHFTLNADGVTDNMSVDGSTTPQIFKINADVTDDIYVTEFTFYSILNDDEPTYHTNNFLIEDLSKLTNGITIEFKTNDVIYQPFLPVKTTEHLITHVASGNTPIIVKGELGFSILKVTHRFEHAVPIIKKQGTFTTDDYLKITINDNLVKPKINEIEALINGYTL